VLAAAHPGDPGSLADLDAATAQTLGPAPQTAADLALRAVELTPPADPAAVSRAVAAAEALTAAGRLDLAARTARRTLARPLPPLAGACQIPGSVALSVVTLRRLTRGESGDEGARSRRGRTSAV